MPNFFNETTAINNYLHNNTSYELVTSLLQSFPLFWVWLASIVVWFFLEISNYVAYMFNIKHTYAYNSSRLSIFSVQFSLMLRNRYMLIFFLQKSLSYYI